MASIKWQQICLGLDVLNITGHWLRNKQMNTYQIKASIGWLCSYAVQSEA